MISMSVYFFGKSFNFCPCLLLCFWLLQILRGYIEGNSGLEIRRWSGRLWPRCVRRNCRRAEYSYISCKTAESTLPSTVHTKNLAYSFTVLPARRLHFWMPYILTFQWHSMTTLSAVTTDSLILCGLVPRQRWILFVVYNFRFACM
jgi:hypothetical protein